MNEFILENPTLFLFISIGVLLWTFPWKGIALWKSARNGHRWWFIAILILNTLAILEIIYIFIIGKKTKKKQEEVLPQEAKPSNGSTHDMQRPKMII